MKKIISIIIFSSLYIICMGQNEFDNGSSWGQNLEGDEQQQRDSSLREESDVPHFKMTWRWAREGVYWQDVPIDTLLDGIQNYNYIFKKSISNTYLGNLPSPYESNIFIKRNPVEDFYQLTYIRAFLYKPEDAIHFNTTTPYTRAQYFTGGGRGKAENLLDVWHVQNLSPFWSAGIRYNLISSDGRYMNQKAKSYHFSVFSSYEKERIALSLFLNQNNGHINENGGLEDRSYITDSTNVKAENMPVNLSGGDIRNSYRNLNFQLQAQYNVGNQREVITEEDTTYTSYPAKFVFNFRVEGNEHWFKEGSINSDFFPRTFTNASSTNDHIQNKIFDVSAKLVLNEHPRLKYIPGIYAGVRYKQENYQQRVAYDSVLHKTYDQKINYANTYLIGGIFNVDTNALINYDVAGSLGLIGDYVGNFKFDGFIRQALSHGFSSYLQADANMEFKNPNPFYNLYVGNHDIWYNDFNNIKSLDLQVRYVNKNWRTDVGAGMSNIWSYIYFNQDTSRIVLPVQTNKNLMVLTAWADQNFRLGKFYFHQKVYVQKSSEEDVLDLPLVSVYSHNYYQNHLFKNALFLQVGFDIFYNTKFYSDNYMPSIMQFHNQRIRENGNYPKVDVFLNFRIKRANLFAKYEHVNYHLKTHGEFLSALDYPINPAMFKFGVQWDFHN